MWYIITNIWLWLLIAFIIGLIVGWRTTIVRPSA